METPVSIQVIPQQVLRDQQVVRIGKALQNVSGVIDRARSAGFGGFFVASSDASDGFEIRGFPNAVTYRNGVRFPGPTSNGFGGRSQRETANLERIEVLKGPGGHPLWSHGAGRSGQSGHQAAACRTLLRACPAVRFLRLLSYDHRRRRSSKRGQDARLPL
ncbi:MAG: TonB-dependent receptor plug domain-containing protein [bacterium]